MGVKTAPENFYEEMSEGYNQEGDAGGVSGGLEGAGKAAWGYLSGSSIRDNLFGKEGTGNNDFQAGGYQANTGSFQNAQSGAYQGQAGQNTANLANLRAPQSSSAQVGRMQGYGGANINTGNQNLGRSMQQNMFAKGNQQLSDINAFINRQGQGPSAAELQLKQGNDRNIAAANALMASNPGLSPGQAAKMAADQATQSNIATNQETAVLRANEAQQAEQNRLAGMGLAGQTAGMMADIGGGLRGQDIGLATDQARLSQEAGLFSSGQQNQGTLAQAGYQQQTNLANQMSEQQLMQMREDLRQKYLQMGMDQAEADRQAQIEYEKIMAEQQISANALNQATAEGNATREQQRQGGVMGAIGSIIGAISDIRMKKNIGPADKKLSTFLEQMDKSIAKLEPGSPGTPEFNRTVDQALPPPAAPAYQAAPQPAQPSRVAMAANPQKEGLASPYTSMQARVGTETVHGTPEKKKPDAPKKKGFNKDAMAAGLAQAGATYASDEKLKTEISPAELKLRDFLDKLAPAKYQYKDEARFGKGERTGVMAQDLEKTPVGKAMVIDTPEGKMVDYGQGFSTMLASQVELHKRLKEVEARMKK